MDAADAVQRDLGRDEGDRGKFLRENGLYTMTPNNSIHTNPPLCITEAQLAEGFEIIDRALDIADPAVTGLTDAATGPIDLHPAGDPDRVGAGGRDPEDGSLACAPDRDLVLFGLASWSIWEAAKWLGGDPWRLHGTCRHPRSTIEHLPPFRWRFAVDLSLPHCLGHPGRASSTPAQRGAGDSLGQFLAGQAAFSPGVRRSPASRSAALLGPAAGVALRPFATGRAGVRAVRRRAARPSRSWPSRR